MRLTAEGIRRAPLGSLNKWTQAGVLFRLQKETDVIQFPKRDPSSETFLTFDVSERIAVILRRWMESKFSMFHIIANMPIDTTDFSPHSRLRPIQKLRLGDPITIQARVRREHEPPR